MGIDIYASWPGMTQQQKDDQVTGFCVTAGNVGYLREAYHGEPYATHFFVSEAFEEGRHEGAQIPADTLKKRLVKTMRLCLERSENNYPDEDPELALEAARTYYEFWKLCDQREKETGQPCTIYASY